MTCSHELRGLFQVSCGAGGIQYRRFCLSCWDGTQAISHDKARAELAELGLEEAPSTTTDQINARRDRYARRACGQFPLFEEDKV
jgi:hypothetical protein